MTRINVVPVSELCNKHVLAEYRELPRVFTLARKCDDAPSEYTLGKGHVKFFYNKLAYLAKRQLELIAECKKRGFNITYTGLPECNKPELFNDYDPTKEAIALNRARIALRISQFKRKSAAP